MWTSAQHRPPPRPRPTPLPAARIRACARVPRAGELGGRVLDRCGGAESRTDVEGPSPGPMWRGRVLDRCGGAESWTDAGPTDLCQLACELRVPLLLE
jgi:hypothetical protein